MQDLNTIPTMDVSCIDKVKYLEAEIGKCPQVELITTHTLHAGMYIRTLEIPADTLVGGALVKIPTILIIQGDILVYSGDNIKEFTGYNIIEAEAHRKQIVRTKNKCYVSMMFATQAKTVEEAEKEFTDEYDNLMTNKNLVIEYKGAA